MNSWYETGERSRTLRRLIIAGLLTLVVNYSESYSAMAVDVSQGGVQLALSPGVSEDHITPGCPVTIKDVPGSLAHLLDGVHGKIAWVGVRCCGVRLNKPLPLDLSDTTDLAKL